MAYIVDGNLYVQDGNNSPKQLSNSGEDIYPMFSDDGENIVFYRGKIQNNNSIFSINADGSRKQEIITKDWLDTLGKGTKA
jgi:Tol biopolymer transport system component